MAERRRRSKIQLHQPNRSFSDDASMRRRRRRFEEKEETALDEKEEIAEIRRGKGIIERRWRWWPKLKPRKWEMTKKKNNGWSQELEEEMRGAVRLLKAKDQNEYRHVGEIAVKINRMLAISGPVLAGLAAVGASASSSSSFGGWPAMLAVVGGAMATVVNTLEHGGQLGMVFELFRNCYGYYKEMEEEIEKNLGEREVDKREDGELFRMKIALKLGRSLSELKSLASYASPSSCRDEDIKEFAGKLF